MIILLHCHKLKLVGLIAHEQMSIFGRSRFSLQYLNNLRLANLSFVYLPITKLVLLFFKLIMILRKFKWLNNPLGN